jgi:hypothetical protein
MKFIGRLFMNSALLALIALPLLAGPALGAEARKAETVGDYFAMHITDCRLGACQSSVVFLLPDGRQRFADPTRGFDLTPPSFENTWQNRRPDVFTDVAALATEIARLAPSDTACGTSPGRFLASGTLRANGKAISFRYNAACADAASQQNLERLIADVREKLDLGLQPLISG